MIQFDPLFHTIRRNPVHCSSSNDRTSRSVGA